MSFARQPHAMLGAGIRCFDLQSGCMQTEAGSASFETAFCRIMFFLLAPSCVPPLLRCLLCSAWGQHRRRNIQRRRPAMARLHSLAMGSHKAAPRYVSGSKLSLP